MPTDADVVACIKALEKLDRKGNLGADLRAWVDGARYALDWSRGRWGSSPYAHLESIALDWFTDLTMRKDDAKQEPSAG